MKTVFIVLLLAGPFMVFCQVASPPTLVAGLSGLSGEKGTLDVELLSEIVTEKQGELKKELAKRLVYNQLLTQNYTSWELAYNTMNMMLNSKSKEGIQKEVLEYSSNAALVYAFTEIYLQVSSKHCNSLLDQVVRGWDPSNTAGYNSSFICAGARTPTFSGLILPRLRRSAIGGNPYPELLSNLLIDLMFDVIKDNVTLKGLGFFRTSLPLGEGFYQANSIYYPLRSNAQVAALRTQLAIDINALIDNYYLVKVIVEDGPTIGTGLPPTTRSGLPPTVRIGLPVYLVDSTYNRLLPPSLPPVTRTLIADLKNLNLRISQSPTKNEDLTKRITEVFSAFSSFIARTPQSSSAAVPTGSPYTITDLYYLDQKILPLVVELTTEYGLDEKYLGYVRQCRTLIIKDLYSWLPTNTSFAPGSPIGLGQIATDFIKVLDNFHKLDKVSSYEEILKGLNDMSKLFEFSNGRVHVIFSSLLDFVDKYTIIDEEKNTISMDVEEIILQIYGQYEVQTNSPVQIYFSVGLNQTFNTSDLSGPEGGSVGFAAEKLGFKLTPPQWNIKKRRAEQMANYYTAAATNQAFVNKSPLISDFHFIAYASGLLYNIVNVKTEEGFNRPLFGVGFGPSFFNSLDLHLFTNWAFPKSGEALTWDKPITGFSFDIKITEYLSRLKSKKKDFFK